MNEEHTPKPEFVNQLEWELESAVRRQGSLNGTSSVLRSVKPKLGTMLALAVVSMFVGGAGTYAATRRANGEAAALYIARSEALVEIARSQLDHVAQELARWQNLHEQGAVTDRELREAEAQFVHAESETNIRELELAETLVTGKEHNDSLSAPLVAGTDYVTKRLEERRRPIQMRLELLSTQARRIQDLVDANSATEMELRGAEMGVAIAVEELNGLEERMALRASFLEGELSAAQVELQGMRFAAVAARETAARQLEMVGEQHNRIGDLSARGMVSGRELRAAEAEMRAAQANMELADLEVRILDQKIAELPQAE
jgi:multidrug resistance efflux pump